MPRPAKPRVVFDASVRPELHAELARRLESSTATSAFQLALDGPLACHAKPLRAACEACDTAWIVWYATAQMPVALGIDSDFSRHAVSAGRCPRCEPERCADEWSDEVARAVLVRLGERFRHELAVMADAKMLEGADVRHPRDVALLAKLDGLRELEHFTSCEVCSTQVPTAGAAALGALTQPERNWLARGPR